MSIRNATLVSAAFGMTAYAVAGFIPVTAHAEEIAAGLRDSGPATVSTDISDRRRFVRRHRFVRPLAYPYYSNAPGYSSFRVAYMPLILGIGY